MAFTAASVPFPVCTCPLSAMPPASSSDRRAPAQAPGQRAAPGAGPAAGREGRALPVLPFLLVLFQRRAHPPGTQPAGGPPRCRLAGLSLRGRFLSDRFLGRRLGGSAPWRTWEKSHVMEKCKNASSQTTSLPFHAPKLSSKCRSPTPAHADTHTHP